MKLKQINKIIAFSLLVMILVISTASCSPKNDEPGNTTVAEPTTVQNNEPEPVADKPLRVAVVLSGKINDGGFNASAYTGLLAAEEKLGIEGAYSEDVQTVDAETAFRDYASKGYDIVIGHGSQYADAMATVAVEFPNIYFAITNADIQGENLAGLDTRNEETGYLAGYVMGKLSKSRIVGFAGSMQIVALLRSEEGFILGAKDACPDCEVISSWTGTWYDPAKEMETVIAMVEKGVDGIQAAEWGFVEGCVEAGCYATIMGGSVNKIPEAPEVIAVSLYHSLDAVIIGIIEEVQQGKFKPNEVRYHGFDTGIYSAELNYELLEKNISAEDIADIEEVIVKLTNNEIDLPHMSAMGETH